MMKLEVLTVTFYTNCRAVFILPFGSWVVFVIWLMNSVPGGAR